MNDADLFAFLDTFRGLQRVFPLRGTEQELREVGASYFKALRRYPLLVVQAGAENCLQTATHFPKPAEWLAALPKGGAPKTLPDLSPTETSEYLRAERLRYEDDPCSCTACKTAGIDEKPLRFVPESDAAGRDVHALIGERIVARGHWAHGDELARWYRARADFYEAMVAGGFRSIPGLTAKQQRVSVEQRIDAIYAKHDPDETPPPVTPMTRLGR